MTYSAEGDAPAFGWSTRCWGEARRNSRQMCLPTSKTTAATADRDPHRQSVLRPGQGYRILEARDGREALHLAHLALPHLRLMVTDVVMPRMDEWAPGQ